MNYPASFYSGPKFQPDLREGGNGVSDLKCLNWYDHSDKALRVAGVSAGTIVPPPPPGLNRVNGPVTYLLILLLQPPEEILF